MWGTDATATFTELEGAVTIFAAIDHCSADCVGIHAVKKSFALRSGGADPAAIKEHFGGVPAASPSACGCDMITAAFT